MDGAAKGDAKFLKRMYAEFDASRTGLILASAAAVGSRYAGSAPKQLLSVTD